MRFTAEQRIIMEKYFLNNETDKECKLKLAEQFKVSIGKINTWFYDRNRKIYKKTNNLKKIKIKNILENFI